MENGVGNKLREARTRRHLGLPDVEVATKIRCRYLQAIENEDWDQLPGDTYARAFIRTYGSFLGLDGERLAEEQRQARGSTRPGERLPGVEPRPGRERGSPTFSLRRVALIVAALLFVVLTVKVLSGGGSSSSTYSTKVGGAKNAKNAKAKPAAAGHSLILTANGEVWVCLLNGKGNPLVKGRVLYPGETEGPFRSGSFTVALGNGAVTMNVDGQQQNLPQPSSPIGFVVDAQGSVRELPEGERPTCS